MFLATFPDKIQLLATEFLRESYAWIVGRVGSTTDSITQVVKEATAEKRHKLRLVVEAVQNGHTLIFVQKKRDANWLRKQLSKGGPEGWDYSFEPIEAVEIHGHRSQSQREAALAKFRSGECRILVPAVLILMVWNMSSTWTCQYPLIISICMSIELVGRDEIFSHAHYFFGDDSFGQIGF